MPRNWLSQLQHYRNNLWNEILLQTSEYNQSPADTRPTVKKKKKMMMLSNSKNENYATATECGLLGRPTMASP